MKRIYLSYNIRASNSLINSHHLNSANGTMDPVTGDVPPNDPSPSLINACFGPSQSMSTQSYIQQQ